MSCAGHYFLKYFFPEVVPGKVFKVVAENVFFLGFNWLG